MKSEEKASRRRRVSDPRSLSISASFAAKEIERIDRVAAQFGWTRSRLVAECVAAVLGSPGDGRVRLTDIQTPVLPGLDGLASAAMEGGPI
jgi:hypothetical protein